MTTSGDDGDDVNRTLLPRFGTKASDGRRHAERTHMKSAFLVRGTTVVSVWEFIELISVSECAKLDLFGIVIDVANRSKKKRVS